ncbi:MAG: radical SAM family heme chaperone HemW [Defluviitaleaceae bacterium]|nr:radical SAM family heme chaperone HemW [Defluviitaleaceae bacterium]
MRDVSIYVHIPFCAGKCGYCDFLSVVGGDFGGYVDALCAEIAAKSGDFGDCFVPTIFFGGGTPTILPIMHIAQIISSIRANFRLIDEVKISIEANPESICTEKLAGLVGLGFNRISIGVQSFIDSHLAAIGRIHNGREAIDSIKHARAAGFVDINLDLIFGLPNQSIRDFADDLQTAISLHPTHIATYSLTIEDDTPMAANPAILAALPDEQTERQMYHMAREFLEKNGYAQYEISNFAKAGYACEHNRRYWLGREYIGFGAGAASFIRHARYTNSQNLATYTAGDFAPSDHHQLTPRDQAAEYAILRLRLTEGLSPADYYKNFQSDFCATHAKTLAALAADGLITQTPSRIALTPLGMDLSNLVFCEFI